MAGRPSLSRKSKHDAMQQISLQCAVLQQTEPKPELSLQNSHRKVSKSQQEKHHEALLSKKYDPTQSTPLLSELLHSGGAAHLIEKLLSEARLWPKIIMLRATCTELKNAVDNGRLLCMQLHNFRKPTFAFHIDDSVSISESNQLVRLATELGGAEQVCSGVSVEIINLSDTDRSPEYIQALLRRGRNLMNVKSAIAWMGCCDANEEGIVNPERFLLTRADGDAELLESLTKPIHQGEEFHSCCFRTIPRREMPASRNASVWVLDENAASLKPLIDDSLPRYGCRVPTTHHHFSPAMSEGIGIPISGTLKTSVGNVVKVLKQRCKKFDTTIPKLLVNVVSDSEVDKELVVSICKQHLTVPEVIVKLWTVDELRPAWPKLVSPSVPASTSHELVGPHRNGLPVDQSADSTYFDNFLSSQPPYVLNLGVGNYIPTLEEQMKQVVELGQSCYGLTAAGKVMDLDSSTELFEGKCCIGISVDQGSNYRSGYTSNQLAAVFDDGTASLYTQRSRRWYPSNQEKVLDLTEILDHKRHSKVLGISIHFGAILVRTNDRLILLKNAGYGDSPLSVVQRIKHRSKHAEILFAGGRADSPIVFSLGKKEDGLKSRALYSVSKTSELRLEKLQEALARDITEDEPADKFHTVAIPSAVKQFSSSGDHVLAVTERGEVWGWGANREGKLGIITSVDTLSAPRMVLGGLEIVHAAAGAEHSVVTTADGKLYSSGRRSKGRLGSRNQKGNQNTFIEMNTDEYQKMKQMGATPVEISLSKASTVVLFKKPEAALPRTAVEVTPQLQEAQDSQSTLGSLITYVDSLPDDDDKQVMSQGLQQLRTQMLQEQALRDQVALKFSQIPKTSKKRAKEPSTSGTRTNKKRRK